MIIPMFCTRCQTTHQITIGEDDGSGPTSAIRLVDHVDTTICIENLGRRTNNLVKKCIQLNYVIKKMCEQAEDFRQKLENINLETRYNFNFDIIRLEHPGDYSEYYELGAEDTSVLTFIEKRPEEENGS